jgi:hypothetical protein
MDNIYAIATAAAKKAGYSNFDKGSDGEEKREEIVLALKRRGMKKASYVRDEQGHKIAGQRISGKYPNRLRHLREAAKYQNRKPEKPIIEQRETADTPKKDPNRAKEGEWKSGKWESKSMWEIWKATYGAKNDQARHFGQRTNVKRNPRLNPNKLGVSDIIKARLPKQAPLRKPEIVDEGMEDDLYPTGSKFSVDRKDQVKKSLLGLLLRNATFEATPEGVVRETKPGAAKAKLPSGKDYTVNDERIKAHFQSRSDRRAEEIKNRTGKDPRDVKKSLLGVLLQKVDRRISQAKKERKKHQRDLGQAAMQGARIGRIHDQRTFEQTPEVRDTKKLGYMATDPKASAAVRRSRRRSNQRLDRAEARSAVSPTTEKRQAAMSAAEVTGRIVD